MRVNKILLPLAVVSAVLWWTESWHAPAAQPTPQTSTVAPAATVTDQSAATAQAPLQPAPAVTELEQSAAERRHDYYKRQAASYRSLLNQRPGNLQQWLDQLWQLCKELVQPACQQELHGLSSQLSAAEMTELKQLLADYGRYQQQMAALQLSTDLTLQARLTEIRQLRQDIFAELTEILFGREHQFASYQSAFNDLQSNAGQLTIPDRLAQLSHLQQQLGETDQSLIGPDLLYQQAVTLLQDLPAAERQQWQQQLREQFFGEQAAGIAAFEQQQQQLAMQRLSYQQELATLEGLYAELKSQLTAEQWQTQYSKALTELRLRHFPAK